MCPLEIGVVGGCKRGWKNKRGDFNRESTFLSVAKKANTEIANAFNPLKAVVGLCGWAVAQLVEAIYGAICTKGCFRAAERWLSAPIGTLSYYGHTSQGPHAHWRTRAVGEICTVMSCYNLTTAIPPPCPYIQTV